MYAKEGKRKERERERERETNKKISSSLWHVEKKCKWTKWPGLLVFHGLNESSVGLCRQISQVAFR